MKSMKIFRSEDSDDNHNGNAPADEAGPILQRSRCGDVAFGDDDPFFHREACLSELGSEGGAGDGCRGLHGPIHGASEGEVDSFAVGFDAEQSIGNDQSLPERTYPSW